MTTTIHPIATTAAHLQPPHTQPPRTQPGSAQPGRTLYLIDIENMVGRSALTISDVTKMQHRINSAIRPSEGDHTVIAASHHNAPAMMFGWRGSAERKMQSGADGADRALLDSLNDIQWIAAHYQRVVITSGDHAFTFPVRSLNCAGIETLVIPPDIGCSGVLRRAAGTNLVPLGSAHPTSIINLFPTSKDAA